MQQQHEYRQRLQHCNPQARDVDDMATKQQELQDEQQQPQVTLRIPEIQDRPSS